VAPQRPGLRMVEINGNYMTIDGKAIATAQFGTEQR
jgi:hypothetical protein